MLAYPHFDPVAFSVGPLKVHWYGITYLVAFGLFYALACLRVRKPWFAGRGWNPREVEDMLFYGVLGVVLGGRLGYVCFYKPGFYLGHPLDVFKVWEGGMSFHGGMLGVLVAMALYGRMRGRRFFEITDLIAPCVPTGLACGRIGNFINGELWGRPADPSLPWAMVFPGAGDVPRHPSQLYEFGMEGLLLFAILWWFGRKDRPLAQVSAVFLTGYGIFRFIAEHFREPDAFLGLRALGLSQGQWLSLPMVLAGLLMFAWSLRQPRIAQLPAPVVPSSSPAKA